MTTAEKKPARPRYTFAIGQEVTEVGEDGSPYRVTTIKSFDENRREWQTEGERYHSNTWSITGISRSDKRQRSYIVPTTREHKRAQVRYDRPQLPRVGRKRGRIGRRYGRPEAEPFAVLRSHAATPTT